MSLGDDWTGPVAGVLGGLGPAATVTFLDQLVRYTDAARDQDHLDAIVLQHASTPDRTDAILHGETAADPGPVLARDAHRLEAAGADFLVLPCNTAHYYSHQITEATRLPLVSIVHATADAAAARARTIAPAEPRVSVFATEGNIAVGIYQEELRERGVGPLVPSPEVQGYLNTLIYGQVKAGLPEDMALFSACVAGELARGAHVVLLGCTELSVIYDRHRHDSHALADRPELVDSLDQLSRATLRHAGKRLAGEYV